MVRILYGVAGEGSGHSTRAKEIINHLISQGNQVKVVSYDKGYENLKSILDVTKIDGLGFVFENNKIDRIKTVLKNIGNSSKMAFNFGKIMKLVKEFQPQIIFSDFEPISATCASLCKIPLISIDNQHFITGTKIEFPKKYQPDFLLAKIVIDLMVQQAKHYLTISFVQTPIKNKKVEIFPPILRQEVLASKPFFGKYILVYLTSGDWETLEILKTLRNDKFIIYGFGVSKKEGNLIFKKNSQKNFLKNLSNCRAVIANAGFSLISEALYLGKPYLAIPVAQQFEQIINGYYLEKMGYGKYWDELDKEKVESFLYNLDLYQKNISKYKRENNSKIFSRIDNLIDKYSI